MTLSATILSNAQLERILAIHPKGSAQHESAKAELLARLKAKQKADGKP